MPTADINPEDCTWDLISTNFAPADVADAAAPPWDVTESTEFTTGSVGGHPVSQDGGPDLWLVHRSRFTVAPGVTLTIKGMHPLVIAADTIDIKGTIVALNGTGPPSCNATRGTDICDGGGGGGGGGYGGEGGDGGGPPVGNGGDRDGILPSPLRGGCPGAQGGDGRNGAGDQTPQPGGAGGAAGGALQLSARLSINVEGSILANGFGGKPGRSDRVAGGGCVPQTNGRAAGGGGGGGGGTIFIESCATVIQPTAKLCANGGAGGGGSGGGTSDTGEVGQDASCDAVASGGRGEIDGQAGGNGGFDGTAATNGQAVMRGGGGGGGAVGRIHVYQAAGPPVTAGATIRPAANRSQ